MKTGCTRAILKALRCAAQPMTCADLVEALGGRYSKESVSGNLVNLVTRGVVHRMRLAAPRGRSRTAYSTRPIREAAPEHRPAFPLDEVWR